MIDEKTLELIKNNRYSEGTNFTEELRSLIHRFYEDFDLDKQDEDYREALPVDKSDRNTFSFDGMDYDGSNEEVIR